MIAPNNAIRDASSPALPPLPPPPGRDEAILVCLCDLPLSATTEADEELVETRTTLLPRFPLAPPRIPDAVFAAAAAAAAAALAVGP